MDIPIYDFRGQKFVNQDGTLSEVAQGFFDALVNDLVKGAGNEGLVVPTQPSAQIQNGLSPLLAIQDNEIKSNTGLVTYTCNLEHCYMTALLIS